MGPPDMGPLRDSLLNMQREELWPGIAVPMFPGSSYTSKEPRLGAGRLPTRPR